RALFVAGVAARKPKPSWQRALAPAMGVASEFSSLSVASLKAAPGQALWSVRKALNSVGIAPPVEIVTESIRAAETDLERAEVALDNDDLDQAERLAISALEHVGEETTAHLDDLSGEQREEAVENIEDVRDEVGDLREDIDKARLELFEERAEERAGDDDSSGPGSGSDDDSDDSDDSSGPGSGDDSDDSSGSGSGDSDSDDSSGSGSGDSGSDDSSGSGSGGSGSDDSSGRGSGSDDSSGKGSGTD
ncbi:MAG: hypothetical protein ACRDKF_13585, partial [Actinomycetota bacterium]